MLHGCIKESGGVILLISYDVWGLQVKRFMPFLEGNRQCIGMSLAKLNYTTAVALLLSHFTFRLADDVSTPGLSS